MTVQEVKNLFYSCNDCKATKLISNVFDGALPPNWTRVDSYPMMDGYGSALRFGGELMIVNHYCEKCSEKREIRQVFR